MTVSESRESKGGKARASSLTPEERTDIARRAAEARWSKQSDDDPQEIPKATHIGELDIGGTIFKCAVLEDRARVLTRATFLRAIGRTGKAKGGRGYDDEFRTPVFLTAKNLQPFIPAELLANSSPIIFNSHGQTAIGYKAELLPQICGVFLDAERAGALTVNQLPIAHKCNILLRGFATVGIIALVDEVTGFQEERDRDELHRILAAYISKELLPWAKCFPDEFYEELFRLRGWQYSPLTVKRPKYVGKLTNELVYDKLPPGVREELQTKNPVVKNGWRKYKHHQFLTMDIGHPHLEKHLVAVTTLMRASASWPTFQKLFTKAFPSYGFQHQLELGLPEEDDD